MAVARALVERIEYILPARFDASEVPGISPTIKSISLSERTPSQFAMELLQKLGPSPVGLYDPEG
jgi:hypothetical protein